MTVDEIYEVCDNVLNRINRELGDIDNLYNKMAHVRNCYAEVNELSGCDPKCDRTYEIILNYMTEAKNEYGMTEDEWDRLWKECERFSARVSR